MLAEPKEELELLRDLSLLDPTKKGGLTVLRGLSNMTISTFTEEKTIFGDGPNEFIRLCTGI